MSQSNLANAMLQTTRISVWISLLLLNVAVASGSARLSPIESGIITNDNRITPYEPDLKYQLKPTTRFFFDGQPETTNRGFLFFNLTSVREPVNAAALRFNVARLDEGPPYPAGATVFLHDVTTTAEAHLSARWIDLGSGELYGSKILREDLDVGSVVELGLSPTAVATINSASEQFGIGVRTRLTHESTYLETSEHELELETSPAAIPEPQSLIIFTAYACLGLLACRRRFGGLDDVKPEKPSLPPVSD